MSLSKPRGFGRFSLLNRSLIRVHGPAVVEVRQPVLVLLSGIVRGARCRAIDACHVARRARTEGQILGGLDTDRIRGALNVGLLAVQLVFHRAKHHAVGAHHVVPVDEPGRVVRVVHRTPQ